MDPSERIKFIKERIATLYGNSINLSSHNLETEQFLKVMKSDTQEERDRKNAEVSINCL